MAMSAAVVDPVGRNANWSVKEREGGGARIAGYRNCLTIIRSSVLQRTEVIDIGRKSLWTRGEAILGTGCIKAYFYWSGTVDVDRDLLNR